MSYEYESKTVGKYTVRVLADDEFLGWGHFLCDEPVTLFYSERFGVRAVFDNMSDRIPQEIWKAIESEDWREVVANVAYDYDVQSPEKIVVYLHDYDQAATYKSWHNAARGVFRREYGYELDDIRVERFDTRSDCYFMVWRQSELDSYAGVKHAKPPRDTVKAVIDGDVWGFTVEDSDSDIVESCWGFVGDAEYCLNEAIATARSFVQHDRKERIARLKTLIQNRVPLVKRAAILESRA